MDNRPVSIKEPIVFFRKSNAALKINYQEGFDMPEKIEIEFWSDRVKADIGPEVTAQISGNTAEFDVPVEVIRILPPQLEAYFLHDGDFLFAGKVFVQMGAAENPSVMELSVSVGADQIIEVEVVGLALIQEQVAIATEKAEEATQGAVTATTQAGIATSGANLATTKAGEAAGSATTATTMAGQAVTAKEGAEAALADTLQAISSKANYEEVNLITDLTFPLSVGLVIVKQDTTLGGSPQVQLYYNDGAAASANDLWMFPMSKRSAVLNT